VLTSYDCRGRNGRWS